MAGECTTCGALVPDGCACAVADTDCISGMGSGNAGNLMTLSPVISDNVDNLASCGASGLLALLPDNVASPPGALVRRTSTQSIPGTGADQVIEWEAEDYDTDGFFLPAADDTGLRITIAGIYLIIAQARLAATTFTDDVFLLDIYINNVIQVREEINATTSSQPTVAQVHTTSVMDVGDRISVQVDQDKGSAVNIEGTSNGTWLAIHRLGDVP